MSNEKFLFIGIALIAIGVLGIFFSAYMPGSWWGPGGWTRSNPMGNMMGGNMMGCRGMMDGWGSRDNRTDKTSFSSNGERIYLYGESKSGKSITPRLEGMGGHMAQNFACADCHGKRRRGGRIDMMTMGSFKVPELTAAHLKEHGYTDIELKRAITKGFSHDGKRLKFPMPRWSMAEEDLDDLIDYLRK